MNKVISVRSNTHYYENGELMVPIYSPMWQPIRKIIRKYINTPNYKYGREWFDTRRDALNHRNKGDKIYFDAGMQKYYLVTPKKGSF